MLISPTSMTRLLLSLLLPDSFLFVLTRLCVSACSYTGLSHKTTFCIYRNNNAELHGIFFFRCDRKIRQHHLKLCQGKAKILSTAECQGQIIERIKCCMFFLVFLLPHAGEEDVIDVAEDLLSSMVEYILL